MWSDAANWTDTVSGGHAVPGLTDYVLFGNGGSNTNCTMDLATEKVDRVEMDSTYTATLNIPSGNVLSTTNYFLQWGTLDLYGNGTIDAGTQFTINGTVTDIPGPGGGTTAHLDTTGDFFLNASATITDVGASPGIPTMEITSGNFDDGGTINVGIPAVAVGFLSITGAFTEQPAAFIEDYRGSLLQFHSGGDPSNYPIIKGTIDMYAATIATDTQLELNLGILNSRSDAAGDLDAIANLGGTGGTVWNLGTINWLGPLHTLSVAGDYTVPPPGTETPGVLNMMLMGGGGGGDGVNDTLVVAGNASYISINITVYPGGTLGTPGFWTLIGASTVTNVKTINFPDPPPGSPGWAWGIGAGGTSLFVTD